MCPDEPARRSPDLAEIGKQPWKQVTRRQRNLMGVTGRCALRCSCIALARRNGEGSVHASAQPLQLGKPHLAEGSEQFTASHVVLVLESAEVTPPREGVPAAAG